MKMFLNLEKNRRIGIGGTGNHAFWIRVNYLLRHGRFRNSLIGNPWIGNLGTGHLGIENRTGKILGGLRYRMNSCLVGFVRLADLLYLQPPVGSAVERRNSLLRPGRLS